MEKTYTCFNGHEVLQGIGNCPTCGAMAYPREPEASKEIDSGTGEISSVPIQELIPLIKPVEPIEVRMPQKTIKSNVGSDTRIEGFDVVITDAKLVPREYCDPSLVKLRAGFKIVDIIPGAQKVPKNIYQTRVTK